MSNRDCERCVFARPFGGENDNRCSSWDCEFIDRKEAIKAYREKMAEKEDDYKIWLEKMLIASDPDWVCDGMCDVGFTDEWCDKHCGEDSVYVTPKCLHMYYHHIATADRKTESQTDVATYRFVEWENGERTIDAVEVVRGEWKPNPKIGWGETWVCSICGEKTTSSLMGYPRYNYCPMCGARMKGESDETD